MVTRPVHLAGHLSALLERAGADVIRRPCMEIVDCGETPENLALVRDLRRYRLVVFVSRNAVEAGFNLLRGAGVSLPADVPVAAVGVKTGERLALEGVASVVNPVRAAGSEALLETAAVRNLDSGSVLVFRGEGGTAPGKIYTALLCGKLARPQTITAPVAGRAAHSRLRPLRACGGFTLAEIRLRTGRTHQARAHAAAAGHPIAGDRRYGDPECNRRLRAAGLRRLFLHARRLRFTHPRTGRAITLTAPLPAELGEVLGRL